jgi:hypothetical protein
MRRGSSRARGVGAVAKRDENGRVLRKRSQQIKAPYRATGLGVRRIG